MIYHDDGNNEYDVACPVCGNYGTEITGIDYVSGQLGSLIIKMACGSHEFHEFMVHVYPRKGATTIKVERADE